MNPDLLQALIFDVDGTLADTEQAHLQAFNEAFAQEGLPWHWDRALYTQLLNVSGGKERITHYWRQVQPDLKIIDSAAFTDTVQR
ncbi:MAG: HAD hydrolase-like protein, partial [Polaromonas sp.]|nr:HAD hydrolase-like protein [Polaromonas sp.]